MNKNNNAINLDKFLYLTVRELSSKKIGFCKAVNHDTNSLLLQFGKEERWLKVSEIIDDIREEDGLL